MIQASEIKVGNRFIREVHNQRGLEYDHDFVMDEIMLGKFFSPDTGWALQDLFPIPLSKEVLLACGFKQQAQDGNLFFLNEFRYSLSGQFITLLRHCDKAGESQKHSCGFPFLTDRVNIKYLHELQNLYYALTKTELNYTP